VRSFTIGDITLQLGDCLELMQAIPDQSIDLVLADLPYGTTQNKWDSVIPLAPLWKEYLRICRGAFVLTAQTPFDKVLGASNLPMLRYEWIWEKSNPTGHLNAKKAPMKAHENVLVFSRGRTIYNPIKTTGHQRKTAVRRECKSTNYGEQKFEPITYDSTERYPRSVLQFPSDKQRSKLHPTQKPVALMEYLMRTYSHPGQLVLDNCFGSATTAIACLNTERRFIGMEKDEAHYQIGMNRVRHAVNFELEAA
jgi:DNA modification methylase